MITQEEKNRLDWLKTKRKRTKKEENELKDILLKLRQIRLTQKEMFNIARKKAIKTKQQKEKS